MLIFFFLFFSLKLLQVDQQAMLIFTDRGKAVEICNSHYDKSKVIVKTFFFALKLQTWTTVQKRHNKTVSREWKRMKEH